MTPFAEFLDYILNVSGDWSVHGLHHALYRSHRPFGNKVIWLLLFFIFGFWCCYLQMSLLHEILFKKPITVNSEVTRLQTINFPNVVVCDLNQEEDKILEFLDGNFANSGMLHRFMVQLSKLELYQDVRTMLRNNVTRALQKYPLIALQYRKHYRKAGSSYRDFSGYHLYQLYNAFFTS